MMLLLIITVVAGIVAYLVYQQFLAKKDDDAAVVPPDVKSAKTTKVMSTRVTTTDLPTSFKSAKSTKATVSKDASARKTFADDDGASSRRFIGEVSKRIKSVNVESTQEEPAPEEPVAGEGTQEDAAQDAQKKALTDDSSRDLKTLIIQPPGAGSDDNKPSTDVKTAKDLSVKENTAVNATPSETLRGQLGNLPDSTAHQVSPKPSGIEEVQPDPATAKALEKDAPASVNGEVESQKKKKKKKDKESKDKDKKKKSKSKNPTDKKKKKKEKDVAKEI